MLLAAMPTAEAGNDGQEMLLLFAMKGNNTFEFSCWLVMFKSMFVVFSILKMGFGDGETLLTSKMYVAVITVRHVGLCFLSESMVCSCFLPDVDPFPGRETTPGFWR